MRCAGEGNQNPPHSRIRRATTKDKLYAAPAAMIPIKSNTASFIPSLLSCCVVNGTLYFVRYAMCVPNGFIAALLMARGTFFLHLFDPNPYLSGV